MVAATRLQLAILPMHLFMPPAWSLQRVAIKAQTEFMLKLKNPGGGLSDYPFHLSANCTSDFAVVDGSGGLVRGDAQSVVRYGAGRYQASFSASVTGCSYTATIGDLAMP